MKDVLFSQATKLFYDTGDFGEHLM